MADFEDISEVNKLLKEAQEAEYDMREQVREDTYFVEKTDGQWEPEIVSKMSGRPRYTFDKCNPVIDSIAGEMEQADFGIKVRPAGGEASQDLAKLYDGMIRNIQSMSNAIHVFNASGRKMVTSGFDAWRVTQDWADTDSFEQDLFIRKIANAVDRVWFDVGAEMQDMSDANHAWVLTAFTKDEHKKKFPDASQMSVGDQNPSNVYDYKAELIMVGEFLYKKEVMKDLVLMSNNAVYEDDEKFQSVVEELKEQGITEQRRRKKKSHVVMSRLFDGQQWLTEPQKTVFDYIPVVPIYGNFDISENKVVYRGVVNKLKDAQRVLNYAQSRDIEEGALAPREKLMITREQAEADTGTLQTMNTNPDPAQLYTHVEGQPQPYKIGGAQTNQGLQITSQAMNQNIVESSSIFAASQGAGLSGQSGIAIEKLQNKGDTSTIKYFSSREVAQTHTCRILVNAIPKVYDTKRTVRILGEDGSSKMESINDQVLDDETQKMVSLNDLRKGKYDVTCDAGQAFKNRQQETVQAFIDLAALDPTLIPQGKDILLSNLQAPGMDLMAERVRKPMLENGLIPDNQMTEEEKEKAQAIIANAEANPPQPSAMDVAITEQTQANTADITSKAQERQDKSELAVEKLGLEREKMMLDAQDKDRQANLQFQKQVVEALNTNADTLNKLRESMGADAIVSPSVAENYESQSEIIDNNQETVEAKQEES